MTAPRAHIRLPKAGRAYPVGRHLTTAPKARSEGSSGCHAGILTTLPKGLIWLSGILTAAPKGLIWLSGISTAAPKGLIWLSGIATAAPKGPIWLSGILTAAPKGLTWLSGIVIAAPKGLIRLSGILTAVPIRHTVIGLIWLSGNGTTAPRAHRWGSSGFQLASTAYISQLESVWLATNGTIWLRGHNRARSTGAGSQTGSTTPRGQRLVVNPQVNWARGSETSLSQCKVVAIEGPGTTHPTAHLTDKVETRVNSGSDHNRDIQTIAYQLS